MSSIKVTPESDWRDVVMEVRRRPRLGEADPLLGSRKAHAREKAKAAAAAAAAAAPQQDQQPATSGERDTEADAASPGVEFACENPNGTGASVIRARVAKTRKSEQARSKRWCEQQEKHLGHFAKHWRKRLDSYRAVPLDHGSPAAASPAAATTAEAAAGGGGGGGGGEKAGEPDEGHVPATCAGGEAATAAAAAVAKHATQHSAAMKRTWLAAFIRNQDRVREARERQGHARYGLLASSTGAKIKAFSSAELAELENRYDEMCDHSEPGRLTRDAFFRHLNSSARGDNARFWYVLNPRAAFSPVWDFRDYVAAAGTICHGLRGESQASLVFDLFDADEDGTVSVHDVFTNMERGLGSGDMGAVCGSGATQFTRNEWRHLVARGELPLDTLNVLAAALLPPGFLARTTADAAPAAAAHCRAGSGGSECGGFETAAVGGAGDEVEQAARLPVAEWLDGLAAGARPALPRARVAALLSAALGGSAQDGDAAAFVAYFLAAYSPESGVRREHALGVLRPLLLGTPAESCAAFFRIVSGPGTSELSPGQLLEMARLPCSDSPCVRPMCDRLLDAASGLIVSAGQGSGGSNMHETMFQHIFGGDPPLCRYMRERVAARE